MISTKISFIIPIFIFVLSFLVLFNITTLPNQPIWDETYYIPSVQKYLDGTFFMESHPPLGKLLITAGELMINPNADYTNLNPVAKLCMSHTAIDNNGAQISLLDYRKTYPNAIDKTNLNATNNINLETKLDKGYSFCGVRFMPTVFAIFIPLLLYVLINVLTKSRYLSAFISMFVLFDNALITHYRAAMIDGFQMVFILLTLIYFVKIIQSQKFDFSPNWFLMLAFSALAIACKHNAVFLLVLPVMLLLNSINIKSIFKLGLSMMFVVLVYVSIFLVHIDNGRILVANSQDRYGYYNSDDKTKEYLNRTTLEFNQFNIFKSNIEYMQNYHLRVPVLDPTNPNENGSYPYTWPLMKKTINYNTNDNKKLTLIGNPVVWAISLITLLLTVWTLIREIVTKTVIQNSLYLYLSVFSGIYLTYFCLMLVSSNLRVMYLYHYFVDLVLSFVLLGIIIKLNNWNTRSNIAVYVFLSLLIVVGFGLISPYTYFLPTPTNYIMNKFI